MEELQNENQPPALWVRNACKQYMFKSKPVVVLDRLNMTVPRGCIYGLLGASGCGKTTLLNCVLNLTKIDSGKILVFGNVPGTKESGIPGPLVGYMPQELALISELSVTEALKYYGWIAGVSTEDIKQKTAVLVKLLALPNTSNRIKHLSGGQQRRISLACTLIHQPELLILDEPTVGLESILRKDIWDYLQQLSQKLITIIITTHYIEETRQADMVGFMRGGCILAEDSPNNVLRRFNEQTLEKVFLKLSIMQNIQQQSIVTDANTNGTAGLDDVDAQSIQINRNARFSKPKHFEKLHRGIDPKHLKMIRIKTQCWRHYMFMLRNISSVVFFIFLAFFQIAFFCLTIGHTPRVLSVSIYNNEIVACKTSEVRLECNSTMLSCVYLKYLEDIGFMLTYYSSEETASQTVLNGKAYASITIQSDFSVSLRNRVKKWIFASSRDLDGAEIVVLNDSTNGEISEYIVLILYKTFKDFIEDYLVSCKLNKRFFTYPVRMEPAVYGELIPNFTFYFLPGYVITFMMFLGITLTASSILTERRCRDYERIKVVGVKLSETIIAFFTLELVLLAITTAIVISTTYGLFKAPLKGSLEVVICLCFLAGLCGMSYGFFIAAVCQTEFTAAILSTSSLVPLIIFSGILWPLNGMHVTLQWLAYVFPVYVPSEALRNIMQKGWGWSQPGVYNGFIYLTIWMLALLTMSSIFFKFVNFK